MTKRTCAVDIDSVKSNIRTLMGPLMLINGGPVCGVMVIGSVAREQAHLWSDVDIVLLVSHGDRGCLTAISTAIQRTGWSVHFIVDGEQEMIPTAYRIALARGRLVIGEPIFFPPPSVYEAQVLQQMNIYRIGVKLRRLIFDWPDLLHQDRLRAL